MKHLKRRVHPGSVLPVWHREQERDTFLCLTLRWTPALFPLARPVGNVSEITSTLLMSVNMEQMVSDCSSGKRSPCGGNLAGSWPLLNWAQARLRVWKHSYRSKVYTFTHEKRTNTMLFIYYTEFCFWIIFVLFATGKNLNFSLEFILNSLWNRNNNRFTSQYGRKIFGIVTYKHT